MSQSILLVDDDEKITQSIKRLFKGEAVNVYEAHSGKGALDIVKSKAIDLVITDQMMPGMNGSEFLSQAVKLNSKLVPIMLSAYSNFDNIVHAVNDGHIVHFLSKPWDNKALKSLVFKELDSLKLKDNQNEELKLLDEMPDPWCLISSSGELQKWNKAFLSQSPIKDIELQGRSFDDVVSLNSGYERITDIVALADRWNEWNGHVKVGDNDKHLTTMRMSVIPYDKNNQSARYLVVLKEDRESEILKKELNKLVLLDIESGALNRSAFIKSTDARINSLSHDEKIIMAVIRIPKLEQLSMTLTTPIFQSMCYKIISRIKALSSRPILVGRISDDKFAVLSEAFSVENYDSTFIAELKELFRQSFRVSDRDIPIVPEIGFCCYPDEADNAAKMVLSAVTASSLLVSNRSKSQPSKQCIFECDFLVNRDVKAAIENGELSLEYQPIIDMEKDSVTGFECLTRWYDKGELVVNTELLINHIHRIGLSKQLDMRVVQNAITQLAFWKKEGIDTCLFINITPSSLGSKHFCDDLIKEALRCDIDAKNINLEVIESSVIELDETFLANIKSLRDFGFRIFLDDFGTGFSSLETLKHLGIDGIKIDRGFIDGVESDKTKHTITKCLFDLASSLGCELVAEGIEQRNQLDCLKRFGQSFYAQGYYFSTPFSASSVVSYLERWE